MHSWDSLLMRHLKTSRRLAVQPSHFTHLLFLKKHLICNEILDFSGQTTKFNSTWSFVLISNIDCSYHSFKHKSGQSNKTIPASCSFETCIPDKISVMKAPHICDQIVINQPTFIYERKGQARSTCANNLNKLRCKLIVCFGKYFTCTVNGRINIVCGVFLEK